MLTTVFAFIHVALIGISSSTTTFEGSLSCNLKFPGKIRQSYNRHSIVTGSRFIAKFSASRCEIVSQSVIDDDEDKKEACLKIHPKEKCTEFSSSVIVLSNGTLYYCQNNLGNPKAYKVTVDSNSHYDWKNEQADFRLQSICLYHGSNNFVVTKTADDDMFFIGTDDVRTDVGNHVHIAITDDIEKKSPAIAISSIRIKKYLTIFAAKDFLYTVFAGNIDYNEKDVFFYITRSCKNESSKGKELFTYTVAKLECEPKSFEKITLSVVLDAYFDTPSDTLYAVFVRQPMEISASILCTYKITDINDAFDSTSYITYDAQGRPLENTQDAMDCSKEFKQNMKFRAKTPIVATVVPLVYPVHFLSFFIHRATDNNTYLYATDGKQMYIFMKNDSMSSFKEVQMVKLQYNISSIARKDNQIYYISQDSLLIGSSFYCNEYGISPIECIKSKNPICGYSESAKKCVPITKCADCKQDLTNGNVSSLYPNGYRYTIKGEDCLKGYFEDTTYIFHVNGESETKTTQRKCNSKTEPVITGNEGLNGRELGLIIGIIIFAGIALVAILILLKRNYQVFPKCNNPTETKKVIYSSDKGVPNLAFQVSQDVKDPQQVIYNRSYTEKNRDDDVTIRRRSEADNQKGPASKSVVNKTFSLPVDPLSMNPSKNDPVEVKHPTIS